VIQDGRAQDFDVGGMVRVRLIGAGPDDANRASRQLGLDPTEPAGEADLTIRFEARLDVPAPLRIIGDDEAGFDDGGFVILGRGSARAIVPFDGLGQAGTIVARRGAGVPHLVPIINLTMLGKGILPLHASAFTYGGRGFVAPAWSKGGKTEVLLAFMAAGASLIADEWTYITPDGRLSGFRGPMRLLAWHLGQLPNLRRRLGMRRSLTLAAVDSLRGGGHIDVPPADLFGPERCSHSGQLDEVLLLVRSSAPGISVKPIAGRTVAERILFAHLHHRLDLIGRYWQFRYAFPDRHSDVLDDVAGRERALLDPLLTDRPAWLVEHPGRVDLRRLVDEIGAARAEVAVE
jgi:hypothetical protein